MTRSRGPSGPARIWDAAGRPTVRWLAPSIYAVVLGHGLRGDDEAADDWRQFAAEVAGEQTRNMHFRVDATAYFVEARLALHFGRPPAVSLPDPPTDPDAWWQIRHWSFDAYPWAAIAELAVASGRPDAAAVLDSAEPVAGENALGRGRPGSGPVPTQRRPARPRAGASNDSSSWTPATSAPAPWP